VVDGVDGGSGLILVVTTEWMVVFCLTFCSSSAGWILKDCRLGEVDILGDGCSDGAWEVLNVSGDLEVVARSCVDVPETFPLGAVWRFVVMLGAGTASVLPVTAPPNRACETAIEIEQERGGRGRNNCRR